MIIGLLVGGILVGQDLIRSASERAQITQIEKFNQATNTFYGKYGALPGDLNQQVANQFGFASRGTFIGQGDGNGVLEGNANNVSHHYGYYQAAGETIMFWSDLTYANGMNINLIDGNFSAASPTVQVSSVTGTALNAYYPAAKIGGGNYVFVMSGGGTNTNSDPPLTAWTNYFGLAAITQMGSSFTNSINSTTGLTVKQAYDIDMKIDDGLPQSGRVLAVYPVSTIDGDGVYWAIGGGAGNDGAHGASDYPVGHGSAVPGLSSITCYDNSKQKCGVTRCNTPSRRTAAQASTAL